MAKLAAQMNRGASMPANGESAMEPETDAMVPPSPSTQLQPAVGTKTSSPVHSEASAAEPVVQRMKTERAPENAQIYGVSNSENVVAGMKTPNHELYLKDGSRIEAINKALEASPLEVYSGSQVNLFHQAFTPVELRFKKVGPGKLDLQDVYEKQVKPGIESQRTELLEQTQKVLPAKESGVKVAGISDSLRSLTASLELFKKLIQTTLADKSGAPGLEPAGKLVAVMEKVIFSSAADSESTTNLLAEIWTELTDPVKTGIPDNRLILETVAEIRGHATELLSKLPKDRALDLISFHKFNFQVDALAMVGREHSNVLLYRACDVAASTVMGNEVNKQNAQQLKVYQTKDAFHFAAKILTEGADWVTLESFAAGDRERSIIGVEDIRNLDQSWQYTMYGSLGGPEKDLSDEDRFFTEYTKLRYYLKGITQPGKFRSLATEGLKPQVVRANLFEHMFSPIKGGFLSKSVSSAQQADALLAQLKDAQVVLGTGLVNTNVRKTKDLKPHLKKEYHPFADEIRNILLQQIPQTAFIQNSISSDVANLAAWKELAGVGDDKFDLLSLVERALVQREKTPGQISRETWIKVGEELAALKKKPSGGEVSSVSEPPLLTVSSSSSPEKTSPVKKGDESEVSPSISLSGSGLSPKKGKPGSREEVIEQGLAELNSLRDQWRLASSERAKKDPPNYAERANAIESITNAPHEMPLGQLYGDVMRWLEQARSAWLG